MDLSNHPHADSFRAECHAFVDWLRDGLDSNKSPIDGREGRNDMEIVEAAYRSAASGDSVRLPL